MSPATSCAPPTAPGFVDGQEVPAYRDEEGVAPSSTTETYFAARCFIDNWRWKGVPFYLRSGKRLAKRATEIAIQFNEVPHLLFGESNPDGVPAQRPRHAHPAR